MTGLSKQSTNTVEIVEHDPQWAEAYESESTRLVNAVGNAFVHFEISGAQRSWSGRQAHNRDDGAVSDLPKAMDLVPLMETWAIASPKPECATGFFCSGRRLAGLDTICTSSRRPPRRTARNAICATIRSQTPARWAAYGALKARLAKEYSGDRLAYTKAKTAFIQHATDALRDEKGLPRINV